MKNNNETLGSILNDETINMKYRQNSKTTKTKLNVKKSEVKGSRYFNPS